MKIIEKLKNMWNPVDDDYEEEYEEEEVEETPVSSQPVEDQSGPSLFRKNTKVVNMNSKAKLYVDIFNLNSFGDDRRDVASSLMNRHAVVLNLEQTQLEDAKRILDFLSGVAFAQDGQIKKIATNTFMITPENVELSGEEIFDELEHSGVYF